jgi:hypothetical protein
MLFWDENGTFLRPCGHVLTLSPSLCLSLSLSLSPFYRAYTLTLPLLPSKHITHTQPTSCGHHPPQIAPTPRASPPQTLTFPTNTLNQHLPSPFLKPAEQCRNTAASTPPPWTKETQLPSNSTASNDVPIQSLRNQNSYAVSPMH